MTFMNRSDNEHAKAERLLLAMATIEDVIDAIRKCTATTTCTRSSSAQVSSDDNQNDDSAPSSQAGGLQEQDLFAEMVDSCWIDDFGPSKRYLKSLVRRYVSLLEKEGIVTESDGLLDLVLRASLSKDTFPEPDEHCYLSFRVPPSDNTIADNNDSNTVATAKAPLLKIKVFPYHNDVALRLWEAGSFLAEYLLHNPSLVAGKKVMELGAGVGLTGLVVAGCCQAESVHLTDYTEECRENLDHNLTTNHDWLVHTGGTVNVSQGYLEWGSFAEQLKQVNTQKTKDSVENGYRAVFFEADILIAADVIYDPCVIPDLVAVVQYFLSVRSSPTTKRQAVFGITKRNFNSFSMFLDKLKECGVVCEWLATGQDYPHLKRIFPCRLHERESDVRVARLSMMER